MKVYSISFWFSYFSTLTLSKDSDSNVSFPRCICRLFNNNWSVFGVLAVEVGIQKVRPPIVGHVTYLRVSCKEPRWFFTNSLCILLHAVFSLQWFKSVISPCISLTRQNFCSGDSRDLIPILWYGTRSHFLHRISMHFPLSKIYVITTRMYSAGLRYTYIR